MAQQRRFLTHGFGPFYCKDSHLLILGSFPSVKSREQAFFYGHPRNRFWPLLTLLCGEEKPESVEDKKLFLQRHRIALYDVIESCSIIGSSDSSIRDVTPADLRPILQGTDIGTRLFTNGGRASALYAKFLLPELGIPAVALPSTSPANAAASLDDLLERWGERLLPILRDPSEAQRRQASVCRPSEI